MKPTCDRSRTYKRVRLIVEGEGLKGEGLDPVGGTFHFTRIKLFSHVRIREGVPMKDVPLIFEAVMI